MISIATLAEIGWIIMSPFLCNPFSNGPKIRWTSRHFGCTAEEFVRHIGSAAAVFLCCRNVCTPKLRYVSCSQIDYRVVQKSKHPIYFCYNFSKLTNTDFNHFYSVITRNVLRINTNLYVPPHL